LLALSEEEQLKFMADMASELGSGPSSPVHDDQKGPHSQDDRELPPLSENDIGTMIPAFRQQAIPSVSASSSFLHTPWSRLELAVSSLGMSIIQQLKERVLQREPGKTDTRDLCALLLPPIQWPDLSNTNSAITAYVKVTLNASILMSVYVNAFEDMKKSKTRLKTNGLSVADRLKKVVREFVIPVFPSFVFWYRMEEKIAWYNFVRFDLEHGSSSASSTPDDTQINAFIAAFIGALQKYVKDYPNKPKQDEVVGLSDHFPPLIALLSLAPSTTLVASLTTATQWNNPPQPVGAVIAPESLVNQFKDPLAKLLLEKMYTQFPIFGPENMVDNQGQPRRADDQSASSSSSSSAKVGNQRRPRRANEQSASSSSSSSAKVGNVAQSQSATFTDLLVQSESKAPPSVDSTPLLRVEANSSPSAFSDIDEDDIPTAMSQFAANATSVWLDALSNICGSFNFAPENCPSGTILPPWDLSKDNAVSYLRNSRDVLFFFDGYNAGIESVGERTGREMVPIIEHAACEFVIPCFPHFVLLLRIDRDPPNHLHYFCYRDFWKAFYTEFPSAPRPNPLTAEDEKIYCVDFVNGLLGLIRDPNSNTEHPFAGTDYFLSFLKRYNSLAIWGQANPDSLVNHESDAAKYTVDNTRVPRSFIHGSNFIIDRLLQLAFVPFP